MKRFRNWFKSRKQRRDIFEFSEQFGKNGDRCMIQVIEFLTGRAGPKEMIRHPAMGGF